MNVGLCRKSHGLRNRTVAEKAARYPRSKKLRPFAELKRRMLVVRLCLGRGDSSNIQIEIDAKVTALHYRGIWGK